MDWSKMRVFDLHSHWGTQKGYRRRTDDELAQQHNTWRSTAKYVSEQEMADYFRRHNTRVILDLGFTKSMKIADVREFHDYALDFQRQHSDVVFGNWLNIDPRQNEALDELKRCSAGSKGFIGFMISGGSLGAPASDPVVDAYRRKLSMTIF